MCIYSKMYTNADSGIFCNKPKLEITQMFIIMEWIYKQWYNSKQQWTTVKYSNMDELCNVEWKKLDTK